MSRRELMPSVKPVTHYQEKINELKKSQREALIEEQVPIIMNAFTRFEKDVTQPVSVNLTHSLEPSLFEELISKGYEVEQMQQYDSKHSKPVYIVRISIPNEDNYHLGHVFDLFSMPFSFPALHQRYPALQAPDKHKLSVKIEELSEPSQQKPQKKQLGEARRRQTPDKKF
jgi:hypothetical protein